MLNALPHTADGAFEIARIYSLLATPAFIVWHRVVTKEMSRRAVLSGGGATQFDALTGNKRDSLKYAIDGEFDPSDTNTRVALDDYCGTQTLLRDAIRASQRRPATRYEKVLSTGTGANSATNPYKLGVDANGQIIEGGTNFEHILDAMGW